MQNWILYTLTYAIFTGFFQCSKKKAVEKNIFFFRLKSGIQCSILQVLFAENI